MSTDTAHDLESLLEVLHELLAGSDRHDMVDGVVAKGEYDDWMRRLRGAMAEHRLAAGERRVDLRPTVRRLDVRTRKDGFRVLHSWNHRTHDFCDEIVPVLMLDFFERVGPEEPDERATLEILLDYYFLHLLALCAMRAWDAEDPDAVLGRVTELIGALQGENGSGHHFVDDSETLLIYAISQFHPEEQAYGRIIDRVSALGRSRRITFAKLSATVLSAHLRWGFWLMYGRDVVRMRNDNVGDYPWLLSSVLTLVRAWVDDRSDDVLESLLLGLAADPWVFTGRPPPALVEHADDHAELRGLLGDHADELLIALETHRPTKAAYAPLGLHFNFPHNALVAVVTLALLEGRPQPLPLNALFTRELEELPGGETQEGLARALMRFSGGSPDRLGHRGAMLVAYDPLSAMRSYSMTTKALREAFVQP